MPMMPRRPAWLLCLQLLWWLACPVVGAQSAMPLPQASAEQIRCFNDLEWGVLQDQVDAIIEDTAEAAVKAAVTPLLADLAGARATAAEWKQEYRKAAADALGARSWALAGWIGTAAATIVAVLAILIR